MTKKILMLTAAFALAATSALAQGKPDKNSQKFIKTAIQHNYAEIDVGKLAQEKGTNPAVKQFGAMLVKDHGDANGKAQSVAKQINVDPPTSADLGHQASYLKLKILQGDTFDKSFIKGMVKDHENDVKEFRKQAGKNDPAGAHAKEVLPHLQDHLSEAKRIQAQLNRKK